MGERFWVRDLIQSIEYPLKRFCSIKKNLVHSFTEMRLWKRASGLLKDQNSHWLASISRRSTFRNPDIEAAVIKATSHDEFSFGYEYPERVYKWLRLSDSNIKPIVRCISSRVEKTHSLVVALKGLILMHGVFSTKLSVIQSIGRLPFDLSNFRDGHTKLRKTWAHNTFIRAYYNYLDQKSMIIFENLQQRRGITRRDPSVMQELLLLQKVQRLLDLLLQIKPLAQAASGFLIVEAMECIVFEVYDIYSRLCDMVANILKRMDSSSKAETALILRILQKALIQGDLEFCREIGVKNVRKTDHKWTSKQCIHIEQFRLHRLSKMNYKQMFLRIQRLPLFVCSTRKGLNLQREVFECRGEEESKIVENYTIFAKLLCML